MSYSYIYGDGLETKRLLTRFLTKDDYIIWADFFNDKESIEFLPHFGLTASLDKAIYWIERQLTRYEKGHFGLQALIDKETKEFIGQCGLVKQEVDGKAEIEVGYHIFKKYRGKSYATEAAKAFIDYAFKNNLANSVISIIDVRNIKSQKVADKSGLIREKQIRWSGGDVYIYRVCKSTS